MWSRRRRCRNSARRAGRSKARPKPSRISRKPAHWSKPPPGLRRHRARPDRGGRMTGPVPPDVVCVADYERHARERLPADVWAYIAGAGADGLTQARNRATFDQIELAGRVLADMSGA